jgi:hypothetical protein
MKNLCALLALVLLAGCTGAHKEGVSRYDDFDAVKVDQMVGNNISGTTFEKTIICLNARRETRRVNAVTNVSVVTVTNAVVTAVTNQTISLSTNLLYTVMTNLAAQTPAPAATTPEAEAVALATIETNTLVAVTPPGPSLSTNITISVANNQTGTASPNQTAANAQQVRTFNSQITTASNNLSISLLTNLVITGETNLVVAYVTNYTVGQITNILVTPTNILARDYFLYTEMTPPADFTLQSGESLVLLVDGVRHGLTQTPSAGTFFGRKRFTSGLYRVSPETLVAIGNAKEVRVRFKGVNGTIERSMNAGSRQNFKDFLVKYFAPEPVIVLPARKVAAAQ